MRFRLLMALKYGFISYLLLHQRSLPDADDIALIVPTLTEAAYSRPTWTVNTKQALLPEFPSPYTTHTVAAWRYSLPRSQLHGDSRHDHVARIFELKWRG